MRAEILHPSPRGKTGMIFRDRKYLKDLGDCWTHQLDLLLQLANLTADLGVAAGANPVLRGYWGVVKNWRETSRYEQITQQDAVGLYEAITNEPDGVFRWTQQHW
jgi:hypothetical protein